MSGHQNKAESAVLAILDCGARRCIRVMHLCHPSPPGWFCSLVIPTVKMNVSDSSWVKELQEQMNSKAEISYFPSTPWSSYQQAKNSSIFKVTESICKYMSSSTNSLGLNNGQRLAFFQSKCFIPTVSKQNISLFNFEIMFCCEIRFKKPRQNKGPENEVNGTEFLCQKPGFSQPIVFIFSTVGVSKQTGKSAFLDNMILFFFSSLTMSSEINFYRSIFWAISSPLSKWSLYSYLYPNQTDKEDS